MSERPYEKARQQRILQDRREWQAQEQRAHQSAERERAHQTRKDEGEKNRDLRERLARETGERQERLARIREDSKLMLDDNAWARKPEDLMLLHSAHIHRLQAELEFTTAELAIRRDDLTICHLLEAVNTQLQIRLRLMEQGWSLLLGKLFSPSEAETFDVDTALTEQMLDMIETSKTKQK